MSPEQRARELRTQVDSSIPVDVEAAAQALNIAVRYQALEDSVSGILVIKQDGAILGVNEKHHRNRQRFTIAHELGHFLLHKEAADVFVDSVVFHRDELSATGTMQQEIDANAFAAELLMPADTLKAKVGPQPLDMFDDARVRRLATEFGVSTHAMTVRLTRLSLIGA
jgi:Zn-dependent peptidase ImmA (M78 family)